MLRVGGVGGARARGPAPVAVPHPLDEMLKAGVSVNALLAARIRANRAR